MISRYFLIHGLAVLASLNAARAEPDLAPISRGEVLFVNTSSSELSLAAVVLDPETQRAETLFNVPRPGSWVPQLLERQGDDWLVYGLSSSLVQLNVTTGVARVVLPPEFPSVRSFAAGPPGWLIVTTDEPSAMDLVRVSSHEGYPERVRLNLGGLPSTPARLGPPIPLFARYVGDRDGSQLYLLVQQFSTSNGARIVLIERRTNDTIHTVSEIKLQAPPPTQPGMMAQLVVDDVYADLQANEIWLSYRGAVSANQAHKVIAGFQLDGTLIGTHSAPSQNSIAHRDGVLIQRITGHRNQTWEVEVREGSERRIDTFRRSSSRAYGLSLIPARATQPYSQLERLGAVYSLGSNSGSPHSEPRIGRVVDISSRAAQPAPKAPPAPPIPNSPAAAASWVHALVTRLNSQSRYLSGDEWLQLSGRLTPEQFLSWVSVRSSANLPVTELLVLFEEAWRHADLKIELQELGFYYGVDGTLTATRGQRDIPFEWAHLAKILSGARSVLALRCQRALTPG